MPFRFDLYHIFLPTRSFEGESVHMVIKTGSNVEKSGWLYCKTELFVCLFSPFESLFSSPLGECYCITFHSAVEVHWLSFVFFSRCVREARERHWKSWKAPHDVKFCRLRSRGSCNFISPTRSIIQIVCFLLQFFAMPRVMSAGTFVGHYNIEHEFVVAAIKKHAKTRSQIDGCLSRTTTQKTF